MAFRPEDYTDLGAGGYNPFDPTGYLSGGEAPTPSVPQFNLDTPILSAYDDATYTRDELGRRATSAAGGAAHWTKQRKLFVDEVLTPYYNDTMGDFAEGYRSTDPERESKMVDEMESRWEAINLTADETPGFFDFGEPSDAAKDAQTLRSSNLWSRFSKVKENWASIVEADKQATQRSMDATGMYEAARQEFDRVPIAL